MSRRLSIRPTPSHPAPAVAEGTDPERTLEDWLVCYLDERDPSGGDRDWRESLLISAALRRPGSPSRSKPGEPAAREDWSKIRIKRRKEALLVRLNNSEYLREADVDDLAAELDDLVAAGLSRIVLSSTGVDRLSCRVVEVFSKLRSSLAERPGGAFRLCGLDPAFAALALLADPALKGVIFADEASALDAPWPVRDRSKALPLTILSALTADGEGPIHSTLAEAEFDCDAPEGFEGDGPRERASVAWLVSERGASRGRAVEVRGPAFLIGRDPSCDLRCASDRVSRRHARIDWRDGAMLLRDLGSTNGTKLDGRAVSSEGAPLSDGSRVEIGSLLFRVELREAPPRDGPIDDLVVDWLRGDEPGGEDLIPFQALGSTEEDLAPAGPATCRVEVIEGVLVVTPRVPQLDDESSVAPLRTALTEAFSGPFQKDVVIDLANVVHLSSLALGVIVAHHLRLVRSGGRLRVCQAHARIVATLEQARLPMLVECFPTVDEAVISAWR